MSPNYLVAFQVWFHQSRWSCLHGAWWATFWIAGLEYVILNMSGLQICHLSTLCLLQPTCLSTASPFLSFWPTPAFLSTTVSFAKRSSTHSLSSSNSSVTQGTGSSGFMEQWWQELLSFRWKLRWYSQSSKMLVSHFVIWQPMGRSCSTLLAQSSSGRRTSPQVKGWVPPSDFDVGTRDRWAGGNPVF